MGYMPIHGAVVNQPLTGALTPEAPCISVE